MPCHFINQLGTNQKKFIDYQTFSNNTNDQQSFLRPGKAILTKNTRK